MKYFKFLLVPILFIVISGVHGQSPNFRLPMVNTHGLNPALLGLGHYDEYRAARIQSGIKAQWLGINKRLASSSLSFDMANEGNSSWGLNFLSTNYISYRQGQTTNFNHTALQATYAYLITGRKVNWNFGLAIQGANYQFGNSNFIWGDQINSDMTAFTNPTNEPVNQLSINSFQAAVGFLVSGKNWFGGAGVYNINEPDIAFFSNSSQPLYRKFNVHAGIKLKKDFSTTSFTPTISYSQQFKSQFWGFDAIFQNGNIFYGLGNLTSIIQDNFAHSIHTFFTVRKKSWGLGYDLDMNLTLNQGSLPLTHEFNIIYLLKSKSLRKAIFTDLPIL